MAYKIEWQEAAMASLKSYREALPRIDEAIRGMEWALARKPFLCVKTRGTSLRFISLGWLRHKNGYSCLIKVAFKIVDDQTVSILWLECQSAET